MADLKDGWNGPMKLTVRVSVPKGVDQNGSGTQWVGQIPPHKDVLQWDTLFEETGNTKVTVSAPKCPEAGAVYEDAWIEVSENKKKPQYPFRTMFTKEEKEKKSQSGGGGFRGGGKSTNYSPEQEAMRDALHIVAICFAHGAYKDKEGNPIPPSSVNLIAAATPIHKCIIEAGKKPEPPQQ